MTNGGGPHGPKAKRARGSKQHVKKASSRRTNWVPAELAKEAARKALTRK
jgi:hypothetical protein